MFKKFPKLLLIFTFLLFSLNGCNIYKYTPAKDTPVKGLERAKKNVSEGRGVTLGGLVGGKGGGITYEFSTSNPLWRASLETLDFLPLSTVDYSGGMIVTDWYSDGSNKGESIKISLRFLSNEIAASSLKVIVHKQNCLNNSCATEALSNSKISEELRSTILRTAILIDKEDKSKRRKK